MNALDSMLRILVEQGGSELRLRSDRRPQMFRDDVELALTMPVMSAERIRFVLDELWTAHVDALRRSGRLAVPYVSGDQERFTVHLVEQEEGALDVRITRGDGAGDAPSPAAVAAGTTKVGSEGASTSRPVSPQPGGAAVAGSSRAADLPAALVELLARLARAGASDLHLSPGRAPVARIDGVLRVLDGEAPVDPAVLLGNAAQQAQVAAGESVDRGLDVPAIGRVRANVYASDDGICAALRILRRDAPSIAELQLPATLESLVALPHGLVVCCGPTGSGKSSTLAALVQHALRTRARVLVTLEDPIEYVLRPMQPAGLVRQREVGTHVRDFATGLRDALREDPDILLIGEMRDPETISLALTAAETGHLVFASLHSRTAPSAVERIVDTYPPERQRQIRVQLADALRAVIAQRLLPAQGGGRVPALELLRVTYGAANLIREGKTAQLVNTLQAGAGEGMLILERHLADLVRAGRISRETAFAAANDPAVLNEYLRGA